MLKTITISAIDLTNERYRVSTDDDIRTLTWSIKHSGLINPPLVRADGSGYSVVSGFRRIRALMENNITQTPAAVIDENGHSDERCAVLAISDNAFQRELNPVELSRGVLLLKPFMEFQTIALESEAIFNTTMNSGFVEKLYRLGTMPVDSHRLILEGSLSMTGALKLSRYPKEILGAFIQLFTAVRMGLNKQLEVITHIHEISTRDGISPIDLIHSEEIKAIVTENPENPSLRASLLRSYLSELRYPMLSAARQGFKEKLKALNLGPGIQLDPPVNFEAMDYSVSFKFNSLTGFNHKLKKLESIALNPELRQILQ